MSPITHAKLPASPESRRGFKAAVAGCNFSLRSLCSFAAIALLSGCQSAAPVYAPMPPNPANAPIEMPAARSTDEVVVAPTMTLVWNPGGYSNFVLVSTGDLRVPLERWPAFLSTDQTNAVVPMDQPAQFFALYGTNADGDSAWATQ